MSYNFDIPSNWKEVSEDKYALIGIVNTENIVCLASFIAEEETESSIISFINYIGFDKNFLFALDAAFHNINETNNLIDGNLSDENYTDTSIISNLFHDFTQLDGNDIYVNINRIMVDNNQHNYSFQVFVEAVNGLLCAQATVTNIDLDNALESALQFNHINEMIRVLFGLKDIQ